MKGVAGHFAITSNSYRLIPECLAEDCKRASRIGAMPWSSLRRFRKWKGLALFVLLVRCFHEPIQSSAGLGVFFHLPIPIVICEGIQRRGQFAAFLRTKLLNRRLNLFHPCHMLSLSASSA